MFQGFSSDLLGEKLPAPQHAPTSVAGLRTATGESLSLADTDPELAGLPAPLMVALASQRSNCSYSSISCVAPSTVLSETSELRASFASELPWHCLLELAPQRFKLGSARSGWHRACTVLPEASSPGVMLAKQ